MCRPKLLNALAALRPRLRARARSQDRCLTCLDCSMSFPRCLPHIRKCDDADCKFAHGQEELRAVGSDDDSCMVGIGITCNNTCLSPIHNQLAHQASDICFKTVCALDCFKTFTFYIILCFQGTLHLVAEGQLPERESMSGAE